MREYQGYLAEEVIATYLGDKELEHGQPAVDLAQVAKFDEMLEIAGRHGLKLIPTFFIGWMSGTVFDVQ